MGKATCRRQAAMATKYVYLFAAVGLSACSDVVIDPAEGGGGSTEGGAPGTGGAPGCDYGELAERMWVDPEWIAQGGRVGQCLALPLTADADGHVSCIVIEARADMPAGCTAENRTPPRAELLEQVMASEGFDPAWTSICEIAQLSGAARDECINEVESSAPGFCFLTDDIVTIGNPEVIAGCAPPRQLLKLSGDVVTPEVWAFSFCDDTPAPCP